MTTTLVAAGQPPGTQERSGTRLVALDGLRIVCALAVAGYHYGVSWRVDGVHPPAYFLPTAAHLLIYGFLGVEVFFLISGFVICMSSWGRGLGAFLWSRFSRLYPAFWICVVLTATVAVLWPLSTGLPFSSTLTLRDLLVSLTMVPQPLGARAVDTVYWTLWVELRFYLLFAVLVSVGGLTYRRVAGFCAGWLAAAAFGPAWAAQVTMPEWAPYFVGGIAIYLIHRFGPDRLLGTLVGVSWLMSMHLVQVRVAELRPGFAVPLWPALLIVTAGYLCLLAVALGHARRIDWAWLRTAGALTYPFYLLHQRIGYTLIRAAHDRTRLPAWSLLTGAVAIILGLAWLVHRYGERPFTSFLRRRFRSRPAG